MKLTSLLVIGLLSCAPLGTAQTKPKPKKPSVKQLKSSLHSVNAKKNQLQAKIRATKRQSGYVIADIEKVDNQLENLENKLDSTRESLARQQERQAELKLEIARIAKQLEAKKVVASKRLRAIFIHSDEANMLDLFLAHDLGDLAARKSIMERIAKRDRELFEAVNQLHLQAIARKKEQDEAVQEVARLLAQQKSVQNELEYRRGLKKGYLKELKDQESSLREQYAVLDHESDELSGKIRAIQEAAARKYGGPTHYSGGGMAWPANGPQTSGFGYRFHPVLHYNRLHAGIDIGAPYGSSVRAASAGTVIIAGYTRGYGNRIVIDHGGGISTLYGHLSRISISEGAKVGRGQRIGAVGSTGLSTGPHLHFEVRRNGTPVNPRGYL